MIRRLILAWLILAVAIGITAALLPGVDIDGGFGSVLWIAVIFGLVNAVLGTILRLLTFPLIVLTLGLFALVINAVLIQVTSWISDSLDFDGFLTALLAALIISVITTVLDVILQPRSQSSVR